MVKKPRRFVSSRRNVGVRASTVKRVPSRLGANGWLALTAVATFAAGALVYVLDRPAATIHLLPRALSLAGEHHPVFGPLGDYLPAFVHVYAFILLTLALATWPARLLPVCASWWAVDSLFELGQHPLLAPHIAAALPAWFEHIPIVDHTAHFFVQGTFDSKDLLAIVLGTIGAYLTVGFVRKREAGHVTDTPMHR